MKSNKKSNKNEFNQQIYTNNHIVQLSYYSNEASLSKVHKILQRTIRWELRKPKAASSIRRIRLIRRARLTFFVYSMVPSHPRGKI